MGQREMVQVEAACRVKCFPNGDTHSATSHQRQLKRLVETVDCFRPEVSSYRLQGCNTHREKAREAFLLSRWGSPAPPHTEKMESSLYSRPDWPQDSCGCRTARPNTNLLTPDQKKEFSRTSVLTQAATIRGRGHAHRPFGKTRSGKSQVQTSVS